MAFTPNMPVQSLFNQSGIQRTRKISGLLIEEVSNGKLAGQLTCFMEEMFPTDEQWLFTLNGQLITSANFPNLVSMTETSIDLTLNKLETVTFPELTTLGASVTIELDDNDQMSSIYFTKLATIGSGFTINVNNPILSIVDMPAVTSVGSNAFINFHGCSLSAESVNEILVSLNRGLGNGTCAVDMGGGTSAAPTGTGLTAKNALVARGWAVVTN